METKRLHRNTTNRIIGGVASGLADYFSIDTLLVRLLFVLFTILGGGALLIYIVLWIVTPGHPAEVNQSQNPINMENQEHMKKQTEFPKNKGNLIGGLVLITLGAIFLADQFIPRIDFGDLWPVILIVIGVGLLVNAYGRKEKKNN